MTLPYPTGKTGFKARLSFVGKPEELHRYQLSYTPRPSQEVFYGTTQSDLSSELALGTARPTKAQGLIQTFHLNLPPSQTSNNYHPALETGNGTRKK